MKEKEPELTDAQIEFFNVLHNLRYAPPFYRDIDIYLIKMALEDDDEIAEETYMNVLYHMTWQFISCGQVLKERNEEIKKLKEELDDKNQRILDLKYEMKERTDHFHDIMDAKYEQIDYLRDRLSDELKRQWRDD